MKISFGEAAVNAVLGYAVVFVGLLLLMCVVVVMGKIMLSRKAAKTPAAPEVVKPVTPAGEPLPKLAVEIPEAPGTAGEMKLYNVADKEAAMIMAIVADELKAPLNTLRFKSIKEIS